MGVSLNSLLAPPSQPIDELLQPIPTAAAATPAPAPVTQPAAPMFGPSPLALPTPEPVEEAEPEVRPFDNPVQARKWIYENIRAAAQRIKPIQNQRYTLALQDVDYSDPEHFSKKREKEAVLAGQTLGRRLRGTWVLSDNLTGKTIDQKHVTLATVPHLTDRGSFLYRGTAYTLTNQLRLRPGAYTRQKENTEIETHVNPEPGSGPSHRWRIDPAKNIFYLDIGQATVPAAPLFKAMGISDEELHKHWGTEVARANLTKDQPAILERLYTKFVGRKANKAASPDEKAAALRELFEKIKFDPEVSRRTLGQEFTNFNKDTALAVTKKLLDVAKGTGDVDDRDSLAFMKLFGPEDLFAERFDRDAGNIRKTALFKATFDGNLKHLQPNALQGYIEGPLLFSGLGQVLEESNPSDVLDKLTRVTRIGLGGIPNVDAVPDESRNVQPSHAGFIDPIRTPESNRAGVDLFFARNAAKGRDGNLYTKVIDARTGKPKWRTPQQLADMTVAFPGEMDDDEETVGVLRNGKMTYVSRDEVDAVLPSMEGGFSPLGNLIPLKSGIKGQRMAMGSRMTTQALPLVGAEAPLVRAADPDDPVRSFDEVYAERLGAVRAPKDKGGRVLQVTDDEVVVRYDDGTKETHEIYKSLPHNRKTFMDQQPVVKQGDVFKPGQLLVRSNYTDDQGVAALGKNLRVAFMPASEGRAFEDAYAISESAAKSLTSTHAYQHEVEWGGEGKIRGLKKFMSLFPTKLTKEQLSKYDEDGVIKPGSTVSQNEPLVLLAAERAMPKNRVHQKRGKSYGDQSEIWDHANEGVVTDVVKTPKGPVVVVKSERPMVEADKLCYDEDTYILTEDAGWKRFAEVRPHDKFACQIDGNTVYRHAHAFHWYPPELQLMYSIDDENVDQLVSSNHRLWVALEDGNPFELVRADVLCAMSARGDVEVVRFETGLDGQMHSVDLSKALRPVWETKALYGITVPGGLVFIRRNGKTCWSGNSGRFGNKGVVRIVPDDEMPTDREGKPFDVFFNPLGIVTRTNPSAALEIVLGKIAEKTGKPYIIDDFNTKNLTQFVKDEANKHGVQFKEDLIDPKTGRKIPGVMTGRSYFMKLHHMAEDKGQGRGTEGAYTALGEPAKGGATGAKRLAMLDTNALIAHGAYGTLREMRMIKGQRREDFWNAFMQGHTPSADKTPVVFEKFLSDLKASGINVVPKGPKLQLMAMRDKDIDEWAEDREITNGSTVNFDDDLSPVPGGLFDPKLTGGHEGNRWSFIRLPEPMPNPAFEEPIRRVLGLTEPKFEAILAGEEEFNGKTGPTAIQEALKGINVKQALLVARAQIAQGTKSAKDAAIRRLKYLKAADRLDIHPAEWMITKMPVLPPRFRPVSVLGDKKLPMVADANFLYKELLEANQNYKQVQQLTGDATDERKAIYNSMKAIVGLADPVQQKLQEKGVQGILKSVFGSSPKHGAVQRRLLATPVDAVGRAVITPDANLSLDEVGIPEEKAWEVYKPFVVRRLRRRGMPVLQALQAVNDRTKDAKYELEKELQERPVIVNRAPVWHKYGIMAFNPKLIKGEAMRVNPLVVVGFGADFDGDMQNYHVPITPDAVKEAKELLMPSQNVLSTSDYRRSMSLPIREMAAGLYLASKEKNKSKPKVFASKKEALQAYNRGEVDFSDEVVLLDTRESK